MRLNNKGFAISVILYSMVILLMGIMYLLLSILNKRYLLSKEIKNEVVDYINTQGVNTITSNYEDKLAVTTLIKKGEMVFQSSNNYYYTGNNPNNYVSFSKEIWRIIGVIKIDNVQYVKIVRAKSLGEYKINNYKIIYSNLFNYLNNDYYNSLTDKNMIMDVNWYNSQYAVTNITAINAYNQEIIEKTYIHSHIGLINASDYGFTVLNSKTTLDKYDRFINDNWLTLTDKNANYDYFTMSYAGRHLNIVSAGGNLITTDISKAHVYPVVYLKRQIIIKSGIGSIDNPYILSSKI